MRWEADQALGSQPVPSCAQELGSRSWAPFALECLVSHPAVTVAIPGTANVGYLSNNLGAARGPIPDAAAGRRITALVDAS